VCASLPIKDIDAILAWPRGSYVSRDRPTRQAAPDRVFGKKGDVRVRRPPRGSESSSPVPDARLSGAQKRTSEVGVRRFNITPARDAQGRLKASDARRSRANLLNIIRLPRTRQIKFKRIDLFARQQSLYDIHVAVPFVAGCWRHGSTEALRNARGH